MSTEIAPVEKSNQVTKQDIDNWLFGTNTKLTENQKTLFYQVALASNLNPAKREVYAIPYGNNFNIITGYEVYLKRAERTGNLDWWEAGVKKENNEYIGFCTIKRKDREKPTTIEAWFNEYNQGNTMWKNKPRTMIRKVAIAQAFRMIFPDELGGLPYTADEMGTDIIEVKATNIEDDDFPTFSMMPTRIKEMIDSLNAAGKLGNAEKFLNKISSQWTDADIDKIEVAKKKNGKPAPEASESPTTHDLPQTNSKAMVDSGGMITDEQIDALDGLISSKHIRILDFIDKDMTKLTAIEAAELILTLAAL